MFDWNESFATGIKEIDNQHQRLFEIGEEIHILSSTYMDETTFEKIKILIKELEDYTVYHFNTEKELFIKYNYPDMGNHLVAHDKFVERIKSIDMEEVRENQEDFLNKLLNSLAQWIFKHINNVDFKYVPYLKESMKQK